MNAGFEIAALGPPYKSMLKQDWSPLACRYFEAARAPETLDRRFNADWTIERRRLNQAEIRVYQQNFQTILRHRVSVEKLGTKPSINTEAMEIVMEDSNPELARHLPIWLHARGRVLITGLGLGCVVRGLLSKPEVEHIDVVEKDPWIIGVVGAEFLDDPRVMIRQGDALDFKPDESERWDYAWHDLWYEDDSLPRQHLQLMAGLKRSVDRQGAWAFPRAFKRLLRGYRGRLGFSDNPLLA